MKVFLVSLPDPPGIHVFRFHAAGFGSSFVMPHPDTQYDVYPPIYETYAAAALEAQGHEARILDCQSPNLEINEICEEIERRDPSLIAARICLPSYYHDLRMVEEIKQRFPDIPIAGWGGVSKVYPEMVLKESQLDMVMRVVELETILPELAEAYEENRMEKTEGISFRKDGEIFSTRDRPFNKNLDMIPIPAYHLLDMKKYVAQESHYVLGGSEDRFIPFFSVSGSRGCSFNCVYCPYPVTYGPWRGRSPEKVVDEIEVLVRNYDIHTIWFHDQTFSMLPERTMRLCDEIIRRDLDIRWATETRVDRLTPRVIRKMKESGCGRLEVGVETGDPDLLKTVGKRGLTPERVDETIENIKKEGIIAETNFLVGLPGETWDSIKKTAELVKRITPDILTVMIVTPYPGTPLFKMAEENNWLLTKDWSQYTLFEPVFSMPDFTQEDMREAFSYLLLQLRVKKRKDKIAKALKNLELGVVAREVASSIPGAFKPKVLRKVLK